MRVFKWSITIVFLVLSAGMVFGADIDVSQPVYATSNGAYDRNPSIAYDGSEYWLFYTKGDDVSTAGVRGVSYNPDGDSYVVYYKTSGTIPDLTSAKETKLELSETGRPANFSQRVASVTYFGGKMYCFVSSGQDGTNRGLYYYVNDGGTWSGPVELIADATARGGHVNVATDGVRIYIVWESSDGSSDCYTWNGTTLSPKIDISSGNMPKITVLQSKLGVLFVVNIEDGTEDIEVFSAVSSPNPLFNPYSTAITGGGFYDPCIFNDGTDLYIVSAPWVATDRQYLVQTKFDIGSSTWSTPRHVNYGGYGNTEWWDFWPCGYFDGGDAYVFLTSETDNGPAYGDAEIAYIKMDWDLSHDHYFFIQNALNQAVTGDAVLVGPGNYEEQLEIDKNLSLSGSGRDVTVVQSPLALSLSFPTTGNVNYPIIFIHGATDVGISELTVDGLGRGNSNYRFAGLAYYNAGGSVDNVHLTGVRDTPFSGSQHGISLYAVADDGGPYAISVTDTDIDDIQKGGMVFSGNGLDATVTSCTVTGSGPTTVTAQNGIQAGYGTTCAVTGCNVEGIWYTGLDWSASGFLLYYPGTGANLSGNTITGCQGALNAYFADDIVLDGNIFDANDFAFLWGGDGGSVTGNTFTANSQAMYIADATNLTFTGNGFDANDYAIIIDGLADGIGFMENDILNSITVGVAVVPYGSDEPANVSLNRNNINGNGLGVDNTTSNMVDAKANWWGDASGPDIAAKSGALIEFDRPRVLSLSGGEISETPQNGSNPVRTDFTGESAVKSGSGDIVSALVDFSPWWGANYIGDPHSSSWNWYVDTTNNSTIQEGVDAAQAGDDIYVMAGTYEAQVVVAKNLTITGAGKESTTIQSPVSLTDYFTTSQKNYPIVYIHDADVDIAGFTIDGFGRGNGNYRFVGIGFWNGDGGVTDCSITGIMDTPFSGSQHGNGIYSYNSTGGPYQIDITNVDVDDFQKNGITLLGANLTATVSGCTVTGVGPTTTTAQNGIQFGYGSGGAILDCTIDGIAYDTAGGWVASAILLYQGTVVDVGTTSITNSQANIIYQETNGAVDDVMITTSGVENEEGISIRDYAYVKDASPTISFAPISPVTEEYIKLEGEKSAPTTVSVTNATLVGVNEPNSYGIAAWALGDNVAVNVEDCDIRQWEIALVAYESGSAADLSAYHTKISGNDMGYWTNSLVMQNAEYNWWGDISGPYHAAGNPLATGNEVADFVDYEPWCNEDFTICDYGQSPQVTLNYPLDASVISDPYAQLSATVSDESPMEIRIYGNRETDPSDLIFVQEGVGGQNIAVDILHDWTAQVMNPEATNTVGLWHFDENSGTEVLDESDNINTGVFNNYDHHAWTAAGRFGYAIEFDGINDYINIPDDPSLDVDPATGALTIEAWIYPHVIGGGVFRAFVSKRDSANATQVNYALYLDQAAGALTLYNGTFTAGYYISNIIPAVNEWSYVAVSLDATEGTLRFYLNGEARDSVSGANFGPAHNGSLTIGTSKTPSGNRDYDGLIDEVRLTKRVLSSAEIAANYALNGGTFYWKVWASDGEHTTISDIWHFTANDTVLPTLEVLSPDPGLTWDHLPTLEIAVGDDVGIDRVLYQIGGCEGTWTEFWSYNSGVMDTTISWQIPAMPNGTYSVYFKAADDAGNVNEDFCSFSWDFTILTIPPDITSVPSTQGYTGGTYTYDVDADGAPEPKYALLTMISGMVIDSLTGIINWTPDEAGNYSVSVRAHNAVGTDTQNFEVSVTDTLDPEVLLVSPENAATIAGFSAALLVTVNDHSDMTVSIYGDKYPSASDLLYVIDNVSGTDIEFNWWTPVFEPDPPYTRGLWHMDENDGLTIADESFQGNTGVTMGSPGWTSDGQFGYALAFDGVDDCIAIGDDGSLDIDSTAGKLTMEAWVYPNSSGLFRDRAIIAKRNHTSTLQNYSMWLSDVSNHLAFAGSDIAAGGWKESSISVPWDMWSYTAVTLDAATGLAIFYLINEYGITVDTVSGAFLGAANNDTLMIGAGGTMTHCFDGYIDEVRVTGKVYSYNEITAKAHLDGNYYWKVKARDAFGNETISSVQFFFVQTYVCGDANGDGYANVGDVVFIINYVFKGGSAPDPLRTADANGDGNVDVGDAVYLINFIFRKGPSPTC